MKFHADHPEATSIIAYGDGWLQIPNQKMEGSVILSSQGLVHAWECDSFEDLSAQHFQTLAELAVGSQVVLFGSGRRNRFPPSAWLRPFIAHQLGLETMDTAAACRTFNVLAGEGRQVVAALLLE